MKRFAESFLPGITIAAIALTHGAMELFPLPLIFPLVFLGLSRLCARIPFRESASRAYLMYFLMGLIGLLAESSALRRTLADETEMGDASGVISSVIVSRIPEILSRTLTPLVCGVAVFVVFGGSPARGTEVALNTSHLQQLNDLLQRARIPEAAACLMQELLTQTTAIQKSSEEFGQSISTSAQHLETVGIRAESTTRQLESLSAQIGSLTSNVRDNAQVVSELASDVSQLHQMVREFRLVAEDFSEIVASKILNFSDELHHEPQETIHAE